MAVTVLNLVTVTATCSRIASGEPSERSSVATDVPACWRTMSSPTRSADVGISGELGGGLEQVDGLLVIDPVSGSSR